MSAFCDLLKKFPLELTEKLYWPCNRKWLNTLNDIILFANGESITFIAKCTCSANFLKCASDSVRLIHFTKGYS